MSAHLAREHDLLELARPYPLHGSLDGVLVVGGRSGAGHARALDWIRIDKRHRGGREPAPPQPLDHCVRIIIGLNDSTEGEPCLAPLPS